MKAILTPNDNLTIEVEGNTSKELFAAVAQVQETFGEKECGCCKSSDIYCRVRTNAKKHEFYEMVCSGCGAILEFGQPTDTTKNIYPKRKLEDGTFDHKHRGWTKFQFHGKTDSK